MGSHASEALAFGWAGGVRSPASATLAPVPDRPVLELFIGDVVRLRRPHPCGGRDWRVDRLGADIGLRCTTCGRHVLLDRATVERRLSGFVERGDPALTAALAPPAAGTAPPGSTARPER
jgi:hypothetical protein